MHQYVVKKILFYIIFTLILGGKVANVEGMPIGNAQETNPTAVPIQNQTLPSDLHLSQNHKTKLLRLLQNTTSENKKVTAAILTLTLGMLGVHRIYLGTAPYIPAVYLFTFGGGFFILPLIDLVMILSTNDISKFENNNKLLMWTGE